MRIITGDLRGRKLQTPKGIDVRPTTDKVKEAVFNIVAEYTEDATVIDLFTGTGNLGLEAISRGAKKCYFCDKSRTSLGLTKENVTYCNSLDKSVFLLGEFENAIKKIKEKADIIFLDPPYEANYIVKSIEQIAKSEILAEDGIIVAEHGKREDLPQELFGFKKFKEKKYGSVIITIFNNGGC